ATEAAAAGERPSLGLPGLADPVRPGVGEAIGACREAGIRTVMLTGDQRATAEAIGRQLGLPPEAIRGRVSPEQKLALVEELQGRGGVVAMTGGRGHAAPPRPRAGLRLRLGRGATHLARAGGAPALTGEK